MLLAYLAVRVASGRPDSRTDTQGALVTVARQPFGHALLGALAAGFGGYAVWQLAMAAFGGSTRAGSDKKGKRFIASISGVLYTAFCASTIALAAGSTGSGGGGGAEADMTAKVMAHPFGRTVVGAVGAVVILAGAVMAWRALSGKRDVRLAPVTRSVRRRIDALAKVGLTARAVIIVVAGVFIAEAAAAFDPHKAKGLDGILKSFAHTSFGPWLLVAAAAGLLAFGLYSLALARYADI